MNCLSPGALPRALHGMLVYHAIYSITQSICFNQWSQLPSCPDKSGRVQGGSSATQSHSFPSLPCPHSDSQPDGLCCCVLRKPAQAPKPHTYTPPLNRMQLCQHCWAPCIDWMTDRHTYTYIQQRQHTLSLIHTHTPLHSLVQSKQQQHLRETQEASNRHNSKRAAQHSMPSNPLLAGSTSQATHTHNTLAHTLLLIHTCDATGSPTAVLCSHHRHHCCC